MDPHTQQRRTRLDRISVRPMSRMDRSIAFGASFVRWEMTESDAGNLAKKSPDHEFIELVVERNCQIVGWMRAARVGMRSDATGAQAAGALKRAWWMQPDDGWCNGAGLQLNPTGDTLLGLGAGLLTQIADSPAEHARVLTMMYEFGRSRLVRQLGLSRWIAQIPLAAPASWQDIYSTAGYVQHVEAGALEDRVLSQLLRRNARVLEVVKHPVSAWIVWENPVR